MKKFVFLLLVLILTLSGACISKPEELQKPEPPRVPEIAHLSGFYEDNRIGRPKFGSQILIQEVIQCTSPKMCSTVLVMRIRSLLDPRNRCVSLA